MEAPYQSVQSAAIKITMQMQTVEVQSDKNSMSTLCISKERALNSLSDHKKCDIIFSKPVEK
jgi:hypothetical protein